MAIPRNLSILAQGANATGVLNVSKGGTGSTTLTVNNVILGNGTNAVQFVAPGTTGNLLTSNGTTWVSSPAPATGVTTLSFGTTGLTPATATNGAITVAGTLALANGGTGATSAGAADTNLRGFTTTATAAGTTTLTNTSTLYQLFTGTSTQTVVLPVTSTLAQGWSFHIVNNSTGNVTVNSSGGNAVIIVPPGTTAMVTCILTTGTTAASWEAGLTDFSTYTGTGAVVLGTSPSLTTPSLDGETFSTTATVTAGTNAQGQGAITSDYNVVTSTPNNPSGVTLPTATTGRRIIVVNRGANSVNIFPATGAAIDAGATNASVSLQANGVVIFNASSTTAWYSTLNLVTSATSGTINPTGGGTDKAFNVNSLTVTTNYTIPSGYSASSTGPITVNSGVTVTIPSGSKWVVL